MQSQNSTPHNFPQPEKSGNTFRRFHYEHGFVILPNELFTDTSISLEAAGLLAFLLQLPETVENEKGEQVPWVVYHNYIRRQRKIGEKQLNRIINELLQAGYMRRERARVQKGRFASYIYDYAPVKKFLPSAVKQSGSSSLDNAVLYNTNPISILKETTTIVVETVDEPSQEAPFVAASSFEEGKTESKKHSAMGSPMSVQAKPVSVTWQQKLGQCERLQQLDIPMYEKEWLLNHFSLPDIEQCIGVAYDPTFQPTKSHLAALKWFLANPDKRPRTPEQKTDKAEWNKKLAKNLEEGTCSEYYQFVSVNKMVLIEPKSGTVAPIEIPYDKEDFEKILEDAMRKTGFKRKPQCQPSSSASMSTERCKNQHVDTKQSQAGEKSMAGSSSSAQHGRPITQDSSSSNVFKGLLETGYTNLRPSGSMP